MSGHPPWLLNSKNVIIFFFYMTHGSDVTNLKGQSLEFKTHNYFLNVTHGSDAIKWLKRSKVTTQIVQG